MKVSLRSDPDGWAVQPFDRFIRQQQRTHGVEPAAQADRHTLLRRAALDLTGLPPTPAEMDAFIADRAPGAWARVVERLLASPRYGERWGRHWLDVVRYADTGGFEADHLYPDAWRYRDYVIRSFNSDKPFDRFIQEQVAGDELRRGPALLAAPMSTICRRALLPMSWPSACKARCLMPWTWPRKPGLPGDCTAWTTPCRFVQIFTGSAGADDWDAAHADNDRTHRLMARRVDQPIAGLLKDLKARGLLEETLVIWGGEFGRTPVADGRYPNKPAGRDHNPYGFTTWLAGGGVKGGKVIGATDEFGLRAVKDRVHINDLHATILKLLGLDHRQLTFLFQGRPQRLTDVGGDREFAGRLLA
jgi:hypothetical protein